MASGKCLLPFLRKYFVKKLLFLTENNLALRQETEPTTAMALDFEEFLHAFAHRAILFFGAVDVSYNTVQPALEVRTQRIHADRRIALELSVLVFLAARCRIFAQQVAEQM